MHSVVTFFVIISLGFPYNLSANELINIHAARLQTQRHVHAERDDLSSAGDLQGSPTITPAIPLSLLAPPSVTDLPPSPPSSPSTPSTPPPSSPFQPPPLTPLTQSSHLPSSPPPSPPPSSPPQSPSVLKDSQLPSPAKTTSKPSPRGRRPPPRRIRRPPPFRQPPPRPPSPSPRPPRPSPSPRPPSPAPPRFPRPPRPPFLPRPLQPQPPSPRPPRSPRPLPPLPPSPRPPRPPRPPSPFPPPPPPSPRPPRPPPPSPKPSRPPLPPPFPSPPKVGARVSTDQDTTDYTLAVAAESIISGGNCPDALELLDRHNFFRARHQAPPLEWDEDLAAASTAYAQLLASQGCPLRHSNGRDYGENLLLTQGYPKPDSSCTPAIISWYSEVKYYDFDAPQPFSNNWPKAIGHFTQVVWKSTSLLGCGVGVADMQVPLGRLTFMGGCKIVVCRYKAPGNYAYDMAFLRNVLRNITEITERF